MSPSGKDNCRHILQHNFEPEFLTLWSRLKEQYPQKEANRHFIAVIALYRHYGVSKLIEAIQQALQLQVTESAAIESILRGLVTEHPEDHEMTQESLPDINIATWECNSDQYAELAGGGV